jgi:Tfp pilus assembly pilus retraction ATPase PilT
MRLLDLQFSDLFIGPDLAWCWYRVTSNSLECVPVPVDLRTEVDDFRAHLQGLNIVLDGRAQWSGEPLRIKRKAVNDGVVMWVVRRFNLGEYSMDGIGLQEAVARELKADHPFLRTGAIGVFGPPGGGKSSTALAITLDRLSLYGGTGWRVGCPVETPMQGKHGNGWLYEMDVARDEMIGDEVRELYRTVPNLILIEEVRDADVAREVVRAAGSGYLVIFTFHGNDLASAIGQFVRLAAGDDLEQTAARVSDFLRVAMYVELHSVPVGLHIKERSFVGDESGKENVLSAQALFFPDNGDGLRSLIRNGEYHMLTNEIARQRMLMMSGGVLAR